jgi:hypothetical protein
METNAHKLLYDYKAAADMLSLTPAALRDLVYKGRGPVTVRIGRRTFFAHKDLEDFIARHRETSGASPETSFPDDKA